MAKRVRFTPKETPQGWRLNIPPKYSESGKRERHFFPTREKAKEVAENFKIKVEQFGTMARAIRPSLAEEAISASALLAPFGISLLEAARRIVEMEQLTASSVSMKTALTEFEKAKETKSDKQKEAIRLLSVHLLKDFADRQMNTITMAEVAKNLDNVTSGPSAFNSKVRLCVTFWRWAAKSPRGWCNADALKDIDKKETPVSEIGVLYFEQASRLMATAEKYFPDSVIPYAIALFTGMRQAELERLNPEDISKEGITIPAVNDRKNNRRRFISTPAPLAAWLKAYPIGETVLPANWGRKEKAVRRMAGWNVWSDLVPTLEIEPRQEAKAPDEWPEWPQNALRHTASSVALALGKSLEMLVFEHGHTEGMETLRQHYIGRMPKDEARLIWTLGPKGTKLPFSKPK